MLHPYEISLVAFFASAIAVLALVTCSEESSPLLS
jgi:hypothetical protein